MGILNEGELEKQSRMLDGDMAKLRQKHIGKVIAYYNHEVISQGYSDVQAISRIPPKYKNLPIVIRTVTAEEDVMGGGPRE